MVTTLGAAPSAWAEGALTLVVSAECPVSLAVQARTASPATASGGMERKRMERYQWGWCGGAAGLSEPSKVRHGTAWVKRRVRGGGSGPLSVRLAGGVAGAGVEQLGRRPVHGTTIDFPFQPGVLRVSVRFGHVAEPALGPARAAREPAVAALLQQFPALVRAADRADARRTRPGG